MKKIISKEKYYRLCRRLCSFIPEKQRTGMTKSLSYASIKMDSEVWVGQKILLGLIVALIGFLIPWTLGVLFKLIDFSIIIVLFFPETLLTFNGTEFLIPKILLSIPIIPLFYSIILAIFLFFSTIILSYLHTYYVIEAKTQMVESVLPDFLLLVASNINAGMTPFAAFRSGARKEFGPLTDEIKITTTKSLGTESFQTALKELGKRIKSKYLNESVAFFSQALKSGGRLAQLLENSAYDLRQIQELKKELISSTKMYVVFVMFVVVIGAPLLLAVSVQFLEMIAEIQAQTAMNSVSEFSSVAFLSGASAITKEFMVNLAYVLLLGNAILSSLFVGILSTGKAKLGLKYMPIIYIISIISFFISGIVLGGFLG